MKYLKFSLSSIIALSSSLMLALPTVVSGLSVYYNDIESELIFIMIFALTLLCNDNLVRKKDVTWKYYFVILLCSFSISFIIKDVSFSMVFNKSSFSLFSIVRLLRFYVLVRTHIPQYSFQLPHIICYRMQMQMYRGKPLYLPYLSKCLLHY